MDKNVCKVLHFLHSYTSYDSNVKGNYRNIQAYSVSVHQQLSGTEVNPAPHASTLPAWPSMYSPHSVHTDQLPLTHYFYEGLTKVNRILHIS